MLKGMVAAMTIIATMQGAETDATTAAQAKAAQKACFKQQSRLPTAWEARKRNAQKPIGAGCVYVMDQSDEMGVFGKNMIFLAVGTKDWRPIKTSGECATVCIPFEMPRPEIR